MKVMKCHFPVNNLFGDVYNALVLCGRSYKFGERSLKRHNFVNENV